MIATLRRTLILTPARLVHDGGQLIMRLAPARTCSRTSSPRSAPCPPPASQPQASTTRARTAATGTPSPRHRRQGTQPRESPSAPEPGATPGNCHVHEPDPTIPRSSAWLWITAVALLVDSGLSARRSSR